LKVHRFLVDVLQHEFGLPVETGFYIPHRRGAVAILVTKVTLAVYHQVTHAPLLGHADHGVEDGGVAVRMEFPHYFPDDTGGFLMRLIAVIAQFVHAEEDTAVHGFQAIPYVRERPADDHRHRIIDVGGLHLLFNVYRDNTIIILRLERSAIFFHIFY